MEKIEGYVDHIIYRNQENGYTVMVLTSEDTEITCVGTFSYIGEGERLEAEGTYIAHPTYGEQFRVETYAIRPPEDEGGRHGTCCQNRAKVPGRYIPDH